MSEISKLVDEAGWPETFVTVGGPYDGVVLNARKENLYRICSKEGASDRTVPDKFHVFSRHQAILFGPLGAAMYQMESAARWHFVPTDQAHDIVERSKRSEE